MRLVVLLWLSLLACGGGEPAAEQDGVSDEVASTGGTAPVGPPGPLTDDQARTHVVRGLIRGPYTVTEACGSCDTTARLVTGDGYEHAFTHDPALNEAVQRCVSIGAVTEIVGRFVDGPGSCGEGQCRYFQAESFPNECEGPNEESTVFAADSYAQCLGTTLQASECMKMGAGCTLLAMVEHPCANSGARCTPERERAVGPATRPCECTCSEAYREWRARLDANRPLEPPP